MPAAQKAGLILMSGAHCSHVGKGKAFKFTTRLQKACMPLKEDHPPTHPPTVASQLFPPQAPLKRYIFAIHGQKYRTTWHRSTLHKQLWNACPA